MDFDISTSRKCNMKYNIQSPTFVYERTTNTDFTDKVSDIQKKKNRCPKNI